MMDKADMARDGRQPEKNVKKTTIKRNTQLRTQYSPTQKRKCEVSATRQTMKTARCLPSMTSTVTWNRGRIINTQSRGNAQFPGFSGQKQEKRLEKSNNLVPRGNIQAWLFQQPQTVSHREDGPAVLLSPPLSGTVVPDLCTQSKINENYFTRKESDPPSTKALVCGANCGQKVPQNGWITKALVCDANCGQEVPQNGCNRENETGYSCLPTQTGGTYRLYTQESINKLAKENGAQAEEIQADNEASTSELVNNIYHILPSSVSFPHTQLSNVYAPTGSSMVMLPRSYTTDFQNNIDLKMVNTSNKSDRGGSAPGRVGPFTLHGQDYVTKLQDNSSSQPVPDVMWATDSLMAYQCPNNNCVPYNVSTADCSTQVLHNAFSTSMSQEGTEDMPANMYPDDFWRSSHSRREQCTVYRHNSIINHFGQNPQQQKFGHVQEYCPESQSTNMSSNETHHSDVGWQFPWQRHTKLDSSRTIASLKQQECCMDYGEHKNYKPWTCQCPGEPHKPTTTFTTSDRTEFGQGKLRCDIHDNKNDTSRSSHQVTQESNQLGLKYESFLKEILKEVAEKISNPDFPKNSTEEPAHLTQLAQATVGNLSNGHIDRSEKFCDHRNFLLKQPSKECTLVNQVSNTPNEIHLNTPKCPPIVFKSYECEKLQYAKNNSNVERNDLQNTEPSPEQSTVSLEVKSVNLGFCCSDKHIENNSRQVRIKWSISPNTKSRWQTESVVIDGSPNTAAHSLSESPVKVNSSMINQKKYEWQTPPKRQENTQDGCSHAWKNFDAVCKSATVASSASSPYTSFTETCKRFHTRESGTTLRSPSPCRANMSLGKRKTNIYKYEHSEKSYFSTSQRSVNFGTASPRREAGAHEFLQRKNKLSSTTSKGYQLVENEIIYKHKCAAQILARNPSNNLVPKTEDRYLLLQLDWGVFIIVVTTIPVVLFLLSLNFYLRASTVTDEARGTKS